MQDKDIIQNLEPYESEITDILGGKTYREYQTGVKLGESYTKTPGMNQVEGGKDMEHTISYPLLLATFRTTEIMDKIKDTLELGEVENSDLFSSLDGKYTLKVDVLKSWEDGNATFIGTGIINHDRWLKLERMGIRPLLYLEKGKYYKSKSGILFDFHNYKPLILTDSDENKNDEIIEVKRVKSLDDLSWDKVKTNKSNNNLENEDKLDVNTSINKETDEEDVINTENIDNIKEEIDKIAESLTKNEEIVVLDSKEVSSKEHSYESLVPDIDLEWN